MKDDSLENDAIKDDELMENGVVKDNGLMENGVAKNSKTTKKVAIALSGGIDSLVAAFLLKHDYSDLFGIHFTTGYEPFSEDQLKNNINELKKQLNIPIYFVDLKEQFEQEVVSYFIETYKMGKTPNPCVICNQKIKFGVLYQVTRDFGADFLATGHYAIVKNNPIISNLIISDHQNSDHQNSDHQNSDHQNSDHQNSAILLKGKDKAKDQSYFLSMLSPEQLSHAIFPLGDFTKQEVIAIAVKNGLVPIQKKESQDICFINQNSFADFISSKCPTSTKSNNTTPIKSNNTTPTKSNNTTSIKSNNTTPIRLNNKFSFAHGDIVTTDNKIVGRHKGLHSYTIGQRRGLNCPGPAPYYVKKIDMKHNRLIVAFKEELFEKEFYVKDVNFYVKSSLGSPLRSSSLLKSLLSSPLRVITRIRYRHFGVPSIINFENISSNGNIINHEITPLDDSIFKVIFCKVIFDEPQFAVTPGQCAVFYIEDQVVGAGFIESNNNILTGDLPIF